LAWSSHEFGVELYPDQRKGVETKTNIKRSQQELRLYLTGYNVCGNDPGGIPFASACVFDIMSGEGIGGAKVKIVERHMLYNTNNALYQYLKVDRIDMNGDMIPFNNMNS